MATRIAINGYGRIGRAVVRALYESGYRDDIQLVAINDLNDAQVHAHLTAFDSVHGRFSYPVTVAGDDLIVGSDRIQVLRESNPAQLDWQALGIDVLLECSGRFTERDKAQIHLQQGAGKVLVSAPTKDADATIVYGVNHTQLHAKDRIVSNASCTTNCLAPLALLLDRHIGIVEGMMTTIHAYTNDQSLVDNYRHDIYRARAAALSMVPTRTGAARAVGQVLPQLAGKLTGMAVRVPTANVSLLDLTFTPARATSVEEINSLMESASLEELAGVLAYNQQPLVSADFNHQPASCTFDSTQTLVSQHLVKVFAWYDNEWGFANRMLDTTRIMADL